MASGSINGLDVEDWAAGTRTGGERRQISWGMLRGLCRENVSVRIANVHNAASQR